MIVQFDIFPNSLMSLGGNKMLTIEERLLSCTGMTLLEVGTVTIIDNTEILIRAAELLGFCDVAIRENDFSGRFDYKFESRFYVKHEQDRFLFQDREQHNKVIGTETKSSLNLIRTSIEYFIRHEVCPINADVGNFLIERHFLG